jgi:methyl-accepting chemotaxis protein
MLKNNLREVRMIGPGGTKIIAGKSLEYENVRMRYIAIQFTLVGIVFLVFGVGVSFAIASRMVRPITQMSATAELLSEKDLGKRIKQLEKQMLDHARNLEFEKAAGVRDQLAQLREQAFGAAGGDNVLPLIAKP